MASEDTPKSAKSSKEELDIISNRIAIALAKRDSLVKSWTGSSSQREPTKTQAEIDAEDASLFHNEPLYLGVGAPIPSHFLVSDAERNNKSLRAKFFPTKGLQASKSRDSEEKAASAKRGLNNDSSDEEEGRSGLGKAKKLKTAKNSISPPKETTEEFKPVAKKEVKAKESNDSPATPPTTPPKIPENKAKELNKKAGEQGPATDSTEAIQFQEQAQEEKEEEYKPRKSINPAKREKLKQKKSEKKRLKKKQLKVKMEQELIMTLAVDTPEWLD